MLNLGLGFAYFTLEATEWKRGFSNLARYS